MRFPDVPDHEGHTTPVLPDGSLARSAELFTRDFVGYQATCSCGWTSRRRSPATPEGAKDAELQWYRHVMPLAAAAPPGWLVVKSDLLCEQIVNLTQERPLAALTLLSHVESWQRTLLDQAVAAARTGGASWAQVGSAMGITKQAAHERFRAEEPS
ncbi:hypothetical protein [Nonomuraea soli]|uniref:Uncharacterized protein n=1 Tax=Nonomuraea soli TaxID=1032476 RepID=A0A7W0HMK1_9ACTN|nr:hypothetical protein [Nonomuraea soli]MBA2888817.1 hypothetical protein [Nonomuraea soli]